MIQVQNWHGAQTFKKHVQKDTFSGSVTDFIATHEIRQPGAQAFLVEQAADWVTPPHFHLEHQFQVVVAGQGSIGRHAVAPLAVHYAAPETGYGPITAGPQGVSYLTLRTTGDTGAWYLHKPGSRERMQPGLKREQQHGVPQAGLRDEPLQTLTVVQEQVMIEPREDGLSAHLFRLPAGATLNAPSRHEHGGRYYVVTDGALNAQAGQQGALSVIHVPAGDMLNAHAGPEGAEVLVLQFPVGAKPAMAVA